MFCQLVEPVEILTILIFLLVWKVPSVQYFHFLIKPCFLFDYIFLEFSFIKKDDDALRILVMPSTSLLQLCQSSFGH